MTRINLVPPAELDKERLTGEYHELPRIFTLVRKRIAKGHGPNLVRLQQPAEYKMGDGHQLFFYTRIKFLTKRFTALCEECLARGYNVDLALFNDIMDSAESIPSEWQGDYEPTPAAIAISRQRIAERMGV